MAAAAAAAAASLHRRRYHSTSLVASLNVHRAPRAAFHQPTYRRASAPRGLVIRSNSQIRKSRCDDVDAGRLHIETWRESRKYRRIASDELQIGFKSRDERCGLYSQK